MIKIPSIANQNDVLAFFKEVVKGLEEHKIWIKDLNARAKCIDANTFIDPTIDVEIVISDNYDINWKS